jgi:hypothetical protein
MQRVVARGSHFIAGHAISRETSAQLQIIVARTREAGAGSISRKATRGARQSADGV